MLRRAFRKVKESIFEANRNLALARHGVNNEFWIMGADKYCISVMLTASRDSSFICLRENMELVELDDYGLCFMMLKTGSIKNSDSE